VQFGLRQVSPVADFEISQPHIDDAYALQAFDLVTEDLAHAADLTIEALGQNNPELVFAEAADLAGFGFGVENAHTASHSGDKVIGYRFVDRDEILLLVIVFRTQDVVDDVAIVGEQNQTFRFLVQPADREDALFMTDEVHDVVTHTVFGGAGDADRFVEADVDLLFLFAPANNASVGAHLVAFRNLRTQLSAFAIDGHTPLGNQGIGLAARAHAGFAEKFVEAHEGEQA